MRMTSIANIGIPNFPQGNTMAASFAGSLHAQTWMQNSQPGINTKTWQGQSQHQKMSVDPPQQLSHNSSKQLQQTQLQNEKKHREYLKQQQRLKAMHLSSSKTVSADALIDNLLEKKDTFAPKQTAMGKGSAVASEIMESNFLSRTGASSSYMGASVADQTFDNLPVWLTPSSSRLPPIYSHIWSLVCDPICGGKFVDTNKILALLLTSSLPKEILGFIWNLATNGANNPLNQQQLYITLALVALAQMGCTFNNLSVLNYMPQPPIPSFNMKTVSDEKSRRSDLNEKFASPSLTPISPAVMPAVSPLPVASSISAHVQKPVSSPLMMTQLDDDDDEFGDFTDFRTSELMTTQSSSSFSSGSVLPSTAVVQPSIAAKQVMNELNHGVVTKLGRNHGRSIGSRLANYSLGAPKTHNVGQKQSRSSVEHDNTYMEDEVTFASENCRSLSDDNQRQDCQQFNDLENEDFSDFQIAAGLNVNVDELFPRCNPKMKIQNIFLKESAIRTESDDEDQTKQKVEELFALEPPTVQSSVPIQSVHLSPPEPKSTKELMSVEEDKYSALRFIEIEANPIVSSSSESCKASDVDDFGDFVSADDLFAEIAVREIVNPADPISLVQDEGWQTIAAQTMEFPINDWGVHDNLQAKPLSKETSFPSVNLQQGGGNLNDSLSSMLSCLNISSEITAPVSKSEQSSEWSLDFDIGKGSSLINLDSSSKCDTVDDDEFGDFVGPQSTCSENGVVKLPPVLSNSLWIEENSSKSAPGLLSDNRSVSSLELPGVTLSRHGSLPSLDLSLFPVCDDGSDKVSTQQLHDWIRCLESSWTLLQTTVNIFANISSQNVLVEVIGAPEGQAYLTNLLEVHRVTWRIQKSLQRSGHDSNQGEYLLTSIQKVWSALRAYYKLANIETAVEKDGSDEDSGQPACGVCGSPASRGVLEYGGHAYHAPCANFWLNCVERTLPAHSSLL